MIPQPPKLFALIRRGFAKRCPHCGKGPLFEKWFTLHSACPDCGYRFERSAGDTWGFWIIGDRILIAAVIAALYFGFTPETWWGRGLFLLSVVIPLVWTMPNRKGVGIALDYLSRIHLEPLDEEFPSLPNTNENAVGSPPGTESRQTVDRIDPSRVD
jgi:uncharacterized protein (DUF983 family)